MMNKGIVAALLIVWTTGLTLRGAESVPVPDHAWGSKKATLTSALGTGQWTEFKPSDRPKYRNKILSYITTIDADLANKIMIVRTESTPMVDYLFVNDKLYTVMEDWGQVDPATEKSIQSRLGAKFGQPVIQKNASLHIYSYHNDATKVLCYFTRLPEGASNCKVYYYTKKLFRLLITE